MNKVTLTLKSKDTETSYNLIEQQNNYFFIKKIYPMYIVYFLVKIFYLNPNEDSWKLFVYNLAQLLPHILVMITGCIQVKYLNVAQLLLQNIVIGTIYWGEMDEEIHRKYSSSYYNQFFQGFCFAIHLQAIFQNSVFVLKIISLVSLFTILSLLFLASSTPINIEQLIAALISFYYLLSKYYTDAMNKRHSFLFNKKDIQWKFIINNILQNSFLTIKYNQLFDSLDVEMANDYAKHSLGIKSTDDFIQMAKNTQIYHNNIILSNKTNISEHFSTPNGKGKIQNKERDKVSRSFYNKIMNNFHQIEGKSNDRLNKISFVDKSYVQQIKAIYVNNQEKKMKLHIRVCFFKLEELFAIITIENTQYEDKFNDQKRKTNFYKDLINETNQFQMELAADSLKFIQNLFQITMEKRQQQQQRHIDKQQCSENVSTKQCRSYKEFTNINCQASSQYSIRSSQYSCCSGSNSNGHSAGTQSKYFLIEFYLEKLLFCTYAIRNRAINLEYFLMHNAKKQEITLQRFSLELELKTQLKVLNSIIQNKKLRVSFTIDDSECQIKYLVTDYQKFRALIFNILYNAVQYCRLGGLVVIHVSPCSQFSGSVKFRIRNELDQVEEEEEEQQLEDFQYIYNSKIDDLIQSKEGTDNYCMSLRMSAKYLKIIGPSDKFEIMAKQNYLQIGFSIYEDLNVINCEQFNADQQQQKCGNSQVQQSKDYFCVDQSSENFEKFMQIQQLEHQQVRTNQLHQRDSLRQEYFSEPIEFDSVRIDNEICDISIYQNKQQQ